MNQEKCKKECCNMCSRSFPPHCDTCPCHTSPKEVKIGDKLEANTEYIADVPSPKEEIHPDYCQCKMCEPPKEEIVNDWETTFPNYAFTTDKWQNEIISRVKSLLSSTEKRVAKERDEQITKLLEEYSLLHPDEPDVLFIKKFINLIKSKYETN